MRTLIFVMIAAFSMASAQNYHRNYSGTASQDTLKNISLWKANYDSSHVQRLVEISVNTPIASDSIFIWEATNPTGARYLAKIIIPSTAPAPFTLFYDCSIDSGYVIIKRYKTSDVTVVYSHSKN